MPLPDFMNFVDCLWSSLVLLDSGWTSRTQWFSLISLIFNDFRLCSLIFIDFRLCSLIFIAFRWFSKTFSRWALRMRTKRQTLHWSYTRTQSIWFHPRFFGYDIREMRDECSWCRGGAGILPENWGTKGTKSKTAGRGPTPFAISLSLSLSLLWTRIMASSLLALVNPGSCL